MRGGPSTNFGDALSSESQKLVNEVRLRINQPIHPNFNTDFNIYRFVIASERLHKKEKEIVEVASKALNNHLRVRKALNLDSIADVPLNENPLSIQSLLPHGDVLEATDSSNRLLFYVEYATINVEGLAHTIRSSKSIWYQFLQFEHMLRKVNQKEEETGRLSGLRHIVDMTGYEINPFTMLFVSNGSLTYYTQLFHYENYPELMSPIEMVNFAKWIHVPYKIARTMMPAGFVDRFRLHDENFLPILQKEIKIEDIPESLGGHNKEIRCKPARKFTPDLFWTPKDLELLRNLETFHVSARKSRQIHIDITELGKKLSWYYSTDGDIFFGVFYEPFEEKSTNNSIITGARQDKEVEVESLEMVYPWLKLAARIVHEMDSIECTRPGRYWLVFCNRVAWIQRRTVNIAMQISDRDNFKRYHTDGTYSCADAPLFDAA